MKSKLTNFFKNMKAVLLFTLILTFSSSFAQDFEWAKGMGGSSLDKGTAIATDVSGNVYTTGDFAQTVDFDPNSGIYNLTSAGSYDVFIQKLDTSGNFIWAKRIGGANNAHVTSITIDASGNVYTIGYFDGTVDFDPGNGVYNLISAGNQDVFILKLNTNGDFIWAKRLGGTFDGYGRSITLDASGNVYTTGHFRGVADFDPGSGTYNLTSADYENYILQDDIFIQKMDSSGNFIWAKRIGGINNDYGYSITIDTLGNIYTTGDFSVTTDFDPGIGTYNLTSVGGLEIYIHKLDNNGNFIWAKRIGGTNEDKSRSIALDALGNIYTTGYFNGTADFNPGSGTYNLTSVGDNDIFIQKMDGNGNFIWAKRMGGINSDLGLSIDIDSTGNVYTTGSFNGTVDFDPGSGSYNLTSAGNKDIFILKLNTNGNFIWAKRMGGTNIEIGNFITTNTLGDIYTTGYFRGTTDFDPDSGIYNLTPAGLNDIFIHKLSQNICLSNNSSLNISNCESYTWSANGQTYTTSGTYTDTLTNVGGCDSIITLNLTINNKPTIIFPYISNMCNNSNPVSLSATPSGGTFSGAGMSGNIFTPSSVSAGNYNITYNYTDTNSCSNSDSITLWIKANPIVNAGSDQSTYYGGSVSLSGSASGTSGPYSYQWTPQAMVVNDTLASTTTLGLIATTYFTLFAIDITTNCSNTDQMSVSVSGSALSISASSDKTTLCSGGSVNLSLTANGGSGSYTYSWTSIPSGTTSTLASLSANPSVSTSYSVTVNDGSTSLTESISIVVSQNPTVSISSLNSAYCVDASNINLSASPSGGTFSGTGVSGNIFSPANANVGSNMIFYSYSDANGCSGSDSSNITVNPKPTVNAGSDQSTYNGGSATLSSSVTGTSGPFTYSWSPSNLVTNANSASTTTVGLSNTTLFTLLVNDNITSCSGTDNMEVSISGSALSLTSNSNKSTICANEPVILTASANGGSGTYSYLWSNASSLASFTANPIISTTYYVTVNDGSSSLTDSVSILVNSNPIVSISGLNTDYCTDAANISLSASPSSGVFSGTGVSGNIFSPANASIGPNMIFYSYSDGNGCSAYDSVSVQINSLPTVNITSNLSSSYCSNASSLSLSASPSGGTHSGNGVSGSIFSPANAGIGSNMISYFYSDANGCSAADSVIVQINNVPSVAITTNLSAAYCADEASLSLAASPTGGTFSGTGVSGNTFSPATANVGINMISYSYSDGNGCTGTNFVNVQINALPTVNISSNLNSSYCSDGSSLILAASPSGGTFSGSGVSGSIFNPANASMGNNMISYFYSDANGCSAADSVIVQINNAPSVVITTNLNTAYCADAANIGLSAVPSGGTFSGTGVSGNIFSPSTASIGSNMIFYSYSDGNGCSAADSVIVQINTLPIVNISSNLNSAYCADAASISLSAIPSGGIFSGLGIAGNNFTPSQAGLGSKMILYSFTDANACSNNDTLFTIINAVPNVNIISSLNANYCSDAAIVNLSASPSGGTFSGNGVSGSAFDPSNANIGNNQIFYNYTDANGCGNSDSISTNINALPSVSFGTLADVCADVQQVSLTSASPSGGSYSGTAVSSQGMFYPQIAGSGTFGLSYSYTDANGCSDTALSSIKVKSLPNSSFSVAATACLNSNVNVYFTGTASASASYTWNFDNAAIASGSGVGPYGLSWNTAGLKQLSLSVVDSGCTSALSNNYLNILSSFAMITAVGSTSVCHGDSVVLFANTGIGYSYQWYDTSGILLGDTLSYLSANQSNGYFCEVTPTNSCAAFSDTIAVVIKPLILADFTLAATACKGDMVAVSFNGSAPVGAIYNWNFDSGTIASGSAVGPYNIIWNIDSIQTVGLTITEGGCSSDLIEKNISIISTPSMITALGSISFCDGDNVSLSANAGSYSYEWFKDGVSTSSSQAIFVASSAGNYQVEVTDVNNSCSNISDSVAVVVNTTDFNLAFSASQTTFSIPPFNTSFSNQTAGANDYYWMWSFGDGNSSTFVNPSHQYGYDGTYSVGVIAQNIASGCFDTLVKTDYITCNGGSANPCTLDPSFGDIGGHSVCPGDSVRLFANDHSAGVSYQWLRDGILIAGASDSVYYASVSGLYQLMLTDASCSIFSNPFSLSLRTTVTPIILANGNIQPCSNDSMELYVSTSFNAYQWSNGANSASIYVNSSGSFIVTVTDNNGCQSSSLPYVVNASLLQVPDICIVGIDTATNHNQVVWERQNSAMIDSFRIYRESTVAGVYDLIGSQPFSTISVFEDVNSNPAQMAYRYRITAVDTCGMETAPSPIHKTLHLTINAGLGGVWNLIWTNYEGFNFGSYRIYRGSDSTSMQLLTQIQSTLTSYTDLNPPTGNVYYQIEIIAPHQCFPDSVYSKANTNYNSSRSNTANTSAAPNTGFVTSVDNQLSMELYPNPNKGNFTLEINSTSNKNQDYQLEIYTVMGKLIHQEQLSASATIRKQMNFETLSKGIYFIRLRSEDNVINTRFVVE